MQFTKKIFGSGETVVVFSHWGAQQWNYFLLKRRLEGRIVIYTYTKNILNRDADSVLKNFTRVVDDAVKEDPKRVIGLSIGSFLAFMLAKRVGCPCTAVTTASNFARGVWEGSATQWYRKGYEQQGMTCAQLEEVWRNIAPVTHIEKLNKVDVLLATKDTVTPYHLGEELIHSLQERKKLGLVKRFPMKHKNLIKKVLLSKELTS